MARPSSSNASVDLPMPPDGTEEENDEGSSVLDNAPPPPARKARATVRPTKKGGVKVEFQSPEGGNGSASVEPQDDGREIVSMVEVESARPSLPKAIQGVLTVKRESVNYDVCEDGVTSAECGYAGTVPDAPGFQDEIIKKWGGGGYIYTGIDKNGKPRSDRFQAAGYSKPIPGTPIGRPRGDVQGNAYGIPFSEFRDADMGASPSDPLGEEYDPSVGVAPEEVAQSTLNGWHQNGQTGRWIYYVSGMPARPPRGSKPPIPAAGFGGPQAYNPYNPSAYDHSEEREKSSKPEFSMVEWLQQQAEERKQREAEERDRRDREREERREEESRRREEENRRRDEERERRENEREERRREEDRKREEERERREHEREERKREDERAREDRKEAARLAAEAAKAQAEAQKEAAKAQAEAVKEAARLQSENMKTLLTMMTAKGDQPQNSFKEGVQMALDFAQGKESSPATEIAEAVERAAPAVANAARDSILAIKGFPPPGTQGVNPALPGPASAPAAPGTPGTPAEQQQAGGGGIPSAQEVVAGLQLTGFLVQAWRKNLPPSGPRFYDGCVAYGLDGQATEIMKKIVMATPELVVHEFKRGVAALGNPPAFVNQIQFVEAMSQDPTGRKWFADLQKNLREALRKPAQVQVQQPAQVTQAQAAPAAGAQSEGGAYPPNPTHDIPPS